mmetsp:Transcript_31389/g.41537  ORF Transcript_31389/g.41537 Transcript_31389/m.41537 type:complete len:98 (-) Transcript_31389:1749-2042(-)
MMDEWRELMLGCSVMEVSRLCRVGMLALNSTVLCPGDFKPLLYRDRVCEDTGDLFDPIFFVRRVVRDDVVYSVRDSEAAKLELSFKRVKACWRSFTC